ncbi:MAG: hypothetical protein ABEN55_08495, partial [Bradymonadaceae bacterium]
AGVLELDVTDDGSLEYFVPGADPGQAMPEPIWKEGPPDDAEPESGQGDVSAQGPERQLPAGEEASTALVASDGPVEEADTHGGEGRPPAEGSDGRVRAAAESQPPKDKGADGRVDRPESGRQVPAAGTDASSLPAPLRDHIEQREASTDGTLDASRGGQRTVVDREATVNAEDKPEVVAALENSDSDLPIHIESTDETFSDPSQTIFMRQLRVEGVESEEALREHVHRLFDSLGYQMVESKDERMRFERGSVTFILALVPLFVLVLPLFVYLFLYCMGRSTIHQEPLELDVQLREQSGREDAYDIDLTFIGLHGVVLGAADPRVLDKEVDTLRDELRWALTTG